MDDQIADSGLMRELAQSIFPVCPDCEYAMTHDPPLPDEEFELRLANLEPRMSRDQVRKDENFQETLFEQGFA